MDYAKYSFILLAVLVLYLIVWPIIRMSIRRTVSDTLEGGGQVVQGL